MRPDPASPYPLSLSLPICTPGACAHNSCLRQPETPCVLPGLAPEAPLSPCGPDIWPYTHQAGPGRVGPPGRAAGWGTGPRDFILAALCTRSSATSPPPTFLIQALEIPRITGHRTSPALIFPLCRETEKLHFPDPRWGLSELQGRGVGEARPLLGMHACGRSGCLSRARTPGAALPSSTGLPQGTWTRGGPRYFQSLTPLVSCQLEAWLVSRDHHRTPMRNHLGRRPHPSWPGPHPLQPRGSHCLQPAPTPPSSRRTGAQGAPC